MVKLGTKCARACPSPNLPVPVFLTMSAAAAAASTRCRAIEAPATTYRLLRESCYFATTYRLLTYDTDQHFQPHDIWSRRYFVTVITRIAHMRFAPEHCNKRTSATFPRRVSSNHHAVPIRSPGPGVAFSVCHSAAFPLRRVPCILLHAGQTKRILRISSERLP